jgi:TetR/AcrR family transcriptional repressor of nem operon
MPWSEDHKQATRERIVAAAARAIREHGPDGVSVAAIMKSVGLTHGGFYAHFASKEALIAEAVSHATAETLAYLDATAAHMAGGKVPEIADVAEAYLSLVHCDHPGQGCVLAACGAELGRAEEPVRSTCRESVHAYLQRFGQHSSGQPQRERLREATGALAAMVGGMVLARAMEDPTERGQILADVRAFVRSALEDRGPSR